MYNSCSEEWTFVHRLSNYMPSKGEKLEDPEAIFLGRFPGLISTMGIYHSCHTKLQIREQKY